MKSFLLTIAMVFCLFTQAQKISLTGTISSEQGEPLMGVDVIVKNPQGAVLSGVVSDFDGNYALKVSVGDKVSFKMMGFISQTVAVKADQKRLDIVLKEDSQEIEEVVVTGVAQGTKTRNLGFEVAKVGASTLQEVPATSPGSALRGKVSGITLVQASGDPNSPVAIRLRGSTSIYGDQQPLIIIDGVITGAGTNLNDINPEDIESMEVVKGAAAASLYGSLAGNGVIQILTKRGKGGKGGGKPTITLRSEVGFSQISNKVTLAKTHRFKLDDSKSWDLNDLDKPGKWVLGSGGVRTWDDDGLLDNPYPRVIDLQDAFFTNKPNYINYFSLGANGERFNYHFSLQNTQLGGIVKDLKPLTRNNARLNFDYKFGEKLKISTSVAYSKVKAYKVDNGTLRSWSAEPWINYLEKDKNGHFTPRPKGLKYVGNRGRNPLYDIHKRKYTNERQRIMMNARLTYKPFEFLTLGGEFSLDESRIDDVDGRPRDYIYPDDTQQDRYPKGQYKLSTRSVKTNIASLYASFNKSVGDFEIGLTVKALREERENKFFSAKGKDFLTDGVESLSWSQADNREIDSWNRPQNVINYFADLNIAWKDKIILNAMIRRDGSSLFGPENRWNDFGRGSLAYILSEDVDIKGIDFFKIRASYGTSGLRPRYDAQFETYTLSRGTPVTTTTGNKKIKSSVVGELETGLNINFLSRYTFSVTYADAKITDNFIKKPLPKVTGFTDQWVNLGRLGYNIWEVEIGADMLKTKNWSWNVTLSWDRMRQQIEDLGGVAPFSRSRGLFRVQEGAPFGMLYGYKAIKDVSQFKKRSDGSIVFTNAKVDFDELNKIRAAKGLGAVSATTLKPSDFEVNEQGYVIIKGSKGTQYEQVTWETDKDGNEIQTEIGNTNSKWNLGFTSFLSYKNWSLFVAMEYRHGGDIYNSAKQRLYRAERHGEQQIYAEQGKHITYSNNASNMDKGYSNTSAFVEDGTFGKLRELALSYQLKKQTLRKIGVGFLDNLKISIIGRNLYTLTDYTGHDPEVGYARSRTSGADRGYPSSSVTNDRIDYGNYPQFRSFSCSLQVKF